jgi:putative cardiolipin synthase
MTIVDGSIAIMGGRNIGDEYFDLGDGRIFRDRGLLSAGPVVDTASVAFDEYWNSEWAFPIEVAAGSTPSPATVAEVIDKVRKIELNNDPPFPLPGSPGEYRGLLAHDVIQNLQWAQARLVYDIPTVSRPGDADERGAVATALVQLAQNASESISIESAYFILAAETGGTLLQELHDRGVQIRALTNSLASNDVPVAHGGYARHRTQMIQSGLELYELRADAPLCKLLVEDTTRCKEEGNYGLHAKSVIFDGKVVFIGSFNVNLRSAFVNTETAIVIDSPQLAQRITANMDTAVAAENSWRVRIDDEGRLQWTSRENGVERVEYSEPDANAWIQLQAGFISLFPLEKYL